LFSQTSVCKETSHELNIPYIPATLKLLTDSGSISNSFINMGLQKITYTNIAAGKYKVQISGQGQSPKIIDSIIVTNERLVININIDGPCLFDYPAGYIPTCPQNHRDSIIQVVYGLFVTKGDAFITEKKDLKVKYAGCVSTGCDPKFYCKLHDIEF
jgi:hypothetical protein